MGLTNFIKKKLEGDPAEKAHKQAVKEAYTTNLRNAEIAGARKAGTKAGYLKGQNHKTSSGKLDLLNNAAQGTAFGINQGLNTFNSSIGMDSFQPARGNNDVFDLEPAHKESRRHESKRIHQIRHQREHIMRRHEKKRSRENYNPLDY